MTTPAFLTTTATPTPCQANWTDPGLWHSTLRADQEEAIRLCAGCPVRVACLAHAIKIDDRWGIWGGLTAAQRHAQRGDGTWLDRDGRVRQPCGTDRARVQHRLRSEQCEICVAAHRARLVERHRRQLDEEHAVGGSSRGRALHRLLGEVSCEPCVAAHGAASVAARASRGRRAVGGSADASGGLRGAQAAVQAAA